MTEQFHEVNFKDKQVWLAAEIRRNARMSPTPPRTRDELAALAEITHDLESDLQHRLDIANDALDHLCDMIMEEYNGLEAVALRERKNIDYLYGYAFGALALLAERAELTRRAR